jgi:hypothetical protein
MGSEDQGAVGSLRSRPDLPRAFIDHQRRLRAARGAAEIAHESGIGQITVGGICAFGRMARNTFYDLFDNVADCLRFGFGEGFELIFAGVREASAEEGPWPRRLDMGLERFYQTVAEEPLWAELCLVHCFGAAEPAAGHDFEAGVMAMVGLLEGGRETAAGDQRPPLPPLAEECLARMIVALAAQRLQQEEAAELPEQRAEMTMLALSTFLGPEEAGRAWDELGTKQRKATQAPAPQQHRARQDRTL